MSLMFLLQQRRGATAAWLAGELDVSVRTVYRDVTALQAAGVPLWTESGPGGGIHLVEGWRTRLDGLTGDEAAALFLAGAPAAVADLGLGAVLTAAESKVIATLPPELRGRASRLRERFHLDAPGWFDAEDTPAALPTVAEAVWAGRQIDVSYERPDGPVSRRLGPLGLVLKAGTWYLVATPDGAPGQIRTYRVGRIGAVEPRDERVDRPDGFELAEWWAASAAAFDLSLLRYRCRVRLAPWALRNLHHYVGPASATSARATATPPDADGWCVLTLPTEREDVALRQLAALAPGVEVLEPESLRQSLHSIGQALADQNAGRPECR